MDFARAIASLEPDLIAWRREFHQIPETALQEHKTAAAIAEKLASWGLTVFTGIGSTGVVGILQGDLKGKGRTIGIRADMDALPVEEETGLPFASRHPGAMHACGHDGHITIALGAARVLSLARSELKGTVVFFFQPAEETLDGAERMLGSDVVKELRVDKVLGYHIWPDLPLGKIAVREGPVMAAVDRFTLEIMGAGGHGAMPHKCVDPIVVACETVVALQRIVSREIDPLKPAVLTVGRIQGGTTFNVIPDRVELEGTVRSYDPEVRDEIPRRMEKIARGVTESAVASYRLEYHRGVPAVINDREFAQWIQGIVREKFGSGALVTDSPPSMGGEDFSLFLRKAPGAYLFLGTRREGSAAYPLHHPKYSIDEAVLPLGVRLLCELSASLLNGE